MTPIRGIGMKSIRTEAKELHRQGMSYEQIAEELGLDEDMERIREWVFGKPRRATRRAPVSPASPEQRAKVKDARSILSGEGPCDPAHIWPRARGGCDDPLCVFPATRSEHTAFDLGELDILPALLAHGYIPELQHALAHARGDLIALLERVTGERWKPV